MSKIDASTIELKATELLKDKKYLPTTDGTQCNRFLTDIAAALWKYTDFNGLSANKILLQAESSADWTSLHDRAATTYDAAFEKASRLAGQGYLVVAGLRESNDDLPSGHVMLVLPGAPTLSGAWSRAKLAEKLPLIAQAGKNNFPPPTQNLAYGITPADAANTKYRFGVYVWKLEKPKPENPKPGGGQ